MPDSLCLSLAVGIASKSRPPSPVAEPELLTATSASYYNSSGTCADLAFFAFSNSVKPEVMVIIAVVVLLGILGALLLIPRNGKSGHSEKVRSDSSTQGSKTYTKADVALHNKRTDCWIIIKDKVYDVTSYVEEHPGGDTILTHAGDDSTEGFFGPQHATRVFDMIEDFYVGHLKQ